MASNATEWPNGHPILRDPRNFTRSEYLIWREELSFYKRELTIQFNDKCDEKRRIQKQVDDASSRSIDDDDDDINDDGWQIQDEYWRSRLDDAWLGLQDLIEAIEIVIKKQNAESSGWVFHLGRPAKGKENGVINGDIEPIPLPSTQNDRWRP